MELSCYSTDAFVTLPERARARAQLFCAIEKHKERARNTEQQRNLYRNYETKFNL